MIDNCIRSDKDMMNDSNDLIAKMWRLADKPERIRVYNKIVQQCGIDDSSIFWDNFWDIWATSENIHEDHHYLKELFQYGNDNFGKYQGDLSSLPETMTVYRGCTEVNKNGWSWTTDYDIAKFFCDRAAGDGNRLILESTVSKDKVINYLTGRGESEVVINPEDIDFNIKDSFEPNNNSMNQLYYWAQTRDHNHDEVFAELLVSSYSDKQLHQLNEQSNVDLPFAEWAGINKATFYKIIIKKIEEKQCV